MIDWTSPDEILRDFKALYAIVVVFSGIFAWEYCLTFPYLEWPLLSGQTRFKWPMIFPLVERLFLLAGNSLYITLLQATTEVDCNAIMKALVSTCVICTTTSSAIFMLRAMTLWNGNRIVTITLVVLQIGQLALWSRCPHATNAYWAGSGCALAHVNQRVSVAAYGYTFAFDMIVAALQVYKLIVTGTSTNVPPGRAKGLGQILFRDGLAYIGSVMFFNLGNIVLFALALNGPMSYMLGAPFLVIEVIMSSRAIIHLQTYGIEASLCSLSTLVKPLAASIEPV